MLKNVAGQKIAVWAWDRVNGVPKTGDAGNITAQISKDGGVSAASDDTNPTELDSTDHPGLYIFDLLQAESNANMINFTPASGTANIVFDPQTVILYPKEVMRGTDSAALATVCTEGRLAELDAANLPTDIADIPTVAEFEARTIVSANYVVVGDTIAGVTLVTTTTTNSDLVTAAAIKTAMEADGGDLSSLMEALVNKLLITEASGNAEVFNDAGVSQGTVAAAFTSVAGVTQRKRMVI